MRYSLMLLVLLASVATAQPPKWVDIQGQVVFPAGLPVPVRKPLAINGNDAKACLAKGALLEETIIVNPKNRGIQNVVVWLRPQGKAAAAKFAANEINPADAKRKPAQVVIDQPCCQFGPHIVACRVGDTIVVKNPAAFAHNFFWASDNNGNMNVNLPASGQLVFKKPLARESFPIPFKCTVHPWMTGYVRVFDHPYFAVTDADGRFTIKNAPAGNYQIVYWHENGGFKDGKAGRLGFPIAIAGNAKNAMEMKPVEFNVK